MNTKIFQLVVIVSLSFLVDSTAKAGLIINEIMQNPEAASDANGEWFELFNTGSEAIDINGWIIEDNNSTHIIESYGPLNIAAGGFLLLGRNLNPAFNGGISLDYEYRYLFLANGSDELALLDRLGNEIDKVSWDDGATFPDPTGKSMALTSISGDNSDGALWKESTNLLANNDFATPGSCNTDVGQNCSTQVPEPASIAILGLGLLGLFLRKAKQLKVV